MSKYIQLSFRNIQPEPRDILIARLSEHGFEGFEETENGLHAFIAEENYNDSLLQQLKADHQLDFVKTILPAENWNRQWESNFNPVIIDDFVAVRAAFHEPITNVEHEIVITPKMSFGTGHHATTRMMMRQMKETDFKGKTVFDFGTGTGILAILAEKLGAHHITAIDNDDWSIENALENIQRNNSVLIDLKKSATIPNAGGFDIILANITKNIILENFSLIIRQLNKNGILLLSGLLAEDQDEILNYSTRDSLKFIKKLQEGNWLCISFLR
ncbi:MAG: ribosomal protein methyltransferase [Chitinophagaceae bacterium]|nr:ribosomal protein methyltransferase [Chitinophagaceae bacterium]